MKPTTPTAPPIKTGGSPNHNWMNLIIFILTFLLLVGTAYILNNCNCFK